MGGREGGRGGGEEEGIAPNSYFFPPLVTLP